MQQNKGFVCFLKNVPFFLSCLYTVSNQDNFDPLVEAELRIDSRSIVGRLETCKHLQTLYGGELFHLGVLQENTDGQQISKSMVEESRSKSFSAKDPPGSRSKISKVVSKRSRLFL
jgi:hypothetical protein